MTDSPPPPPSGQPGPPPAPPGMYLASDGRYYPGQDAPAVQPPPLQAPPMQPPPVKKGGGGKVVLIVAGVLFALCALGGTITALAIAGQTDEPDEPGAVALTSTTASGSPGTTSGGTGAFTTRTQTTKAGFGDVAITACGLPNNEFLGPEATVKITNSSSKPSNYLVQLGFLSADGATQYDTSNAIVSQLAPGQSSEQKATSVDSDVRAKVATSGLVCKVLDVTRLAA